MIPLLRSSSYCVGFALNANPFGKVSASLSSNARHTADVLFKSDQVLKTAGHALLSIEMRLKALTGNPERGAWSPDALMSILRRSKTPSEELSPLIR